MKNKVVARYADGRMVKGSTSDFVPTKDAFHVADAAAGAGAPPIQIQLGDLKALFFVKDFAGRPSHKTRNEFAQGRAIPGRKIQVVFKDGETLVGTTQGYQPGRPGFFMVPADPDAEHRALLRGRGLHPQHHPALAHPQSCEFLKNNQQSGRPESTCATTLGRLRYGPWRPDGSRQSAASRGVGGAWGRVAFSSSRRSARVRKSPPATRTT